ncbi:MAG: ABC transporter permease, partial [Phaeodactylibacter sp.]|nr:ABC transporter permease [Phaeodactylibacter sp.]
MERVLFNFFLAMEGVNANKLRSFLTALGIVFGVGAVIAMLAIGTGAKQAILEQMKLIGTNNIVIKGLELTDEGQNGSSSGTGASGSSDSGEKRTYSPGLTLKDAEAIQAILPAAERVSPEVVLATNVVRNGRLEKGRCVGITNAFFDLNNLGLATGRLFHDKHIEQGASVCIIGKEIQARFFSQEDPLGQQLKCGNTWLTIIGVLDRRKASQESLSSLGIRDYNSDVYIPVTTALLRFRNRALVNQNDLGDEDSDEDENRDPNHNQLDQLVVRIGESDKLKASADVIARILKRRHYDVVDFQVEVPELLLEQEQKTQDTFNLVLAAIAGISLLVGGIGIMNIMLVRVTERTREIG